VPGEYEVAIESSAPSTSGAAGEVGEPSIQKPSTADTAIPARYTDAAKSGFSARVTADGVNTYQFDMKPR
jgi:hypothetical protein